MGHQHISNELNLSKNPNVIASKMTNEQTIGRPTDKPNEQTKREEKINKRNKNVRR